MDKKTYLSWLQERSGAQQQQVNEIAPLLAAGAGMLARTVATRAVTGAATQALGSGVGQAAANLAGNAVGGIVTNALTPHSEGQTVQEDPPIKKNKKQKKVNEAIGAILKTLGTAAGHAALNYVVNNAFGSGDDEEKKRDRQAFTDTPTGAAPQSLAAVSVQTQSNKTNVATKPTKSLSSTGNKPPWWSYEGTLNRFAIPGMAESLNVKVDKHVNKFLKSKEGNALKGEVKEILKTS